MINTAKIFINGRSQAIRLPKEYRFKGNEVYINKIDDIRNLTIKNGDSVVRLSDIADISERSKSGGGCACRSGEESGLARTERAVLLPHTGIHLIRCAP